MTSRSVFSTALLFTLLVPAAGAGTHEETDSSAPGVYLLVEVNGIALPAVSGTKSSEGRVCTDEVLQGTMLLDSEGSMATLLTEREICTERDGSRTTGGEKSVIFIGSYELSAEHMTFHWEIFDDDDEGSLTEGVLVLNDVSNEGQTREWVLRKVDY